MQCANRPPHWHEGYIYCGCNNNCPDDAGEKWMYRRRRERIHLGPQIAEIVVHLHRNYQAGLKDGLNVVLKIHRYRCNLDEQPVAELRPYASINLHITFQLVGSSLPIRQSSPRDFIWVM